MPLQKFNMKIEIKSVTHGEYEEVQVLHIYPHSEQMNLYRRYDDHWDHLLGKQGWISLIDPALFEDTYQTWMRNAKKTTNK